MIEDIVPDYVAGAYDKDPEAKAQVEEIIRIIPAARDLYDNYTATLSSRTPEQWEAAAKALIARFHACDMASPAPVETQEARPSGRAVARVPTSGIIRRRQWFSGLLGDFSESQPAIYDLSRSLEVKKQTWKLELGRLGLPDEERCARLPWAGRVRQISRTNSKDAGGTYFAYIEESDDKRPHGVLLVRISTADGQAFEVRLTKNDRMARFRATKLPMDPKALRIEVAIA